MTPFKALSLFLVFALSHICRAQTSWETITVSLEDSINSIKLLLPHNPQYFPDDFIPYFEAYGDGGVLSTKERVIDSVLIRISFFTYSGLELNGNKVDSSIATNLLSKMTIDHYGSRIIESESFRGIHQGVSYFNQMFELALFEGSGREYTCHRYFDKNETVYLVEISGLTSFEDERLNRLMNSVDL